MPHNNHVVVTGVAGFIGSNLLAKLLARGYRVTGVDNLANGFMRNIEPFLSDSQFTFVKADITDPATLRALSGIDFIVHLAAYKIPRYGNGLDTLRINLRGTENVLEAARETGCKIVFASTSDVYGKNPKIPFCETDDIVLGESGIARWAYAASKLFDEHLCFAYRDQFKIRVAILRYFGGYGKNQHTTWWGGPQSVFIDAILKGRSLDIHGDGLQTRSFTYVDDLVNGTLLAMENEASSGEIFNLGDTHEITILGLAELIWATMKGGGRPPINFVPYSSFYGGKYEDVRRRIPDITKARTILGFVPAMPLAEGLKLTIDWQKNLAAHQPAAGSQRQIG
jgi:UDP-glucose 4-epimerase